MTETEIKPSYLQADVQGRTQRCGWTGDWPPPEQMLMVVPIFAEPTWLTTEVDEKTRSVLREGIGHGWQVFVLVKISHSQISDADYAGMTHVARGAEYEVAGPWGPDD